MPALSAGASGSTPLTIAPSALGKPSASATSLLTSPICTPIRPRVTLPLARNCSTIDMASLIGIASEIPMKPPLRDTICELMPTTSPFMLSNGPPELPGLTATSVWIKGRYSPVSRPKALTIPEVTVDSRPKGEPIAITHCPFLSSLALPIGKVAIPLASTLSKATSVRSSLPMTLAVNSLPLVKVT